MNINTVKKLNKLNQDFYNQIANDFDSSRQYYWKGWDNLSKYINNFSQLKLIDLGCGNCRFYDYLKTNFPNKKINYLGIDNNVKLLEFAQEKESINQSEFSIQKEDIISSLINKKDFIKNNNYDLIVSFGVFHHIPSFELRLEMLKYLGSKINFNGLIIISLWQFMNYPRFKNKIADKSTLEKMEITDLENNDYILDWNRGTKALRYCHFSNQDEQYKLVKQSGLKLVASFHADGKEQDLNTYLIIQK